MDPELLERIRCPESRQPLRPAEPGLVGQLNARMNAEGGLKNRAGRSLTAALEGGLIREDGQWLYPILHGIPILLVDEAIPLGTATPA